MSRRFLTALPVFNEEAHIAPVLKEVQRYSQEILVINDGSSDRTAEILAEIPGIHVVTHPENQGYGAALRSAFEFSMAEKFDVLITIDCDGQHQPALIPELVASVYPPAAPPVDIVSGSRYLQVFPDDSLPPEERRRINVAITERVNRDLGMQLTDTFCGFKAYRVAALEHFQITELGYAMPLQLWVQAAAANLKIVEFPVPLIYLDEERSFGGSLDDANRRLAYYDEVLDREMARVPLLANQTKPTTFHKSE